MEFAEETKHFMELSDIVLFTGPKWFHGRQAKCCFILPFIGEIFASWRKEKLIS